jgi:uncharacterized repeat protein (TIGR04138 family)
MPPSGKLGKLEPPEILERVVEELGIYPIEAYEFVQQGLAYTVSRIYGEETKRGVCRHVTGQQLCQGLRELALRRWGFLAKTVFLRWNVTSTLDFGQIVFSLARHRAMSTRAEDSINDFRNVYDFAKAFEASYRVPVQL